MTFSQKKIDLTIKLGTGAFGTSGENTLILSGLRVQCNIQEYGNENCAQAAVRVYGMTPDHMRALTALQAARMMERKNTLQIAAGDDAGMSTIFQGQIKQGHIDMSAPPDACLNILAWAGGWEKVAIADPMSYPGSASVAQIMATLSKRMGYVFENNGVTEVLSTPALGGTDWEKARSVADAAGINWTISNGKLAIWPRDGFRATTSIPLISKDTGMVGYPGYFSAWNGIEVTTIFNPALKLGGLVDVKSSLVNIADGRWTVLGLAHDLASQIPNAPWFSRFEAMPAEQGN